jgi:phage protein D
MADPPVYGSAAPVLTVAGTRQPELARDLVRLDIEETTEGLRRLTLHLIASAARSQPSHDVVEYLDGRPLDFGAPVQVVIGQPGTEKVVFTGTVSAIAAEYAEADAPVVVIRAEDDLMRLRMAQRSATYLRSTDADVVRAVASRHGLGAAVDLDGPRYDVVQQFNQSDLAFLRERARRLQADLWFADGKVQVATRDRRRGTAVTLTRGSDLLTLTASADLAEQCSAVRVSGYDASARQKIDAEAPAETVEAETSGGRTGPQTLQRTFGALPGRRVRDVPVVESEARAVARAEMLRRSRRFVRLRGMTSGSPLLVVGSVITLRSCGRPFDGGGYYATRVHHTFDLADGMRTHFEAERPTVSMS